MGLELYRGTEGEVDRIVGSVINISVENMLKLHSSVGTPKYSSLSCVSSPFYEECSSSTLLLR